MLFFSCIESYIKRSCFLSPDKTERLDKKCEGQLMLLTLLYLCSKEKPKWFNLDMFFFFSLGNQSYIGDC